MSESSHCPDCENASDACCLRCGRSLCAEHMHDGEQRCIDCEGEFARSWHGQSMRLLLLCVLVVAGGFALMIQYAQTGVAVDLAGLVVMAMVPPIVILRAKERRRQRFLAERPLPEARVIERPEDD